MKEGPTSTNKSRSDKSRREILKTGLLAAGILAFPGTQPSSASTSVDETPDPLRGLKLGITSYSVRKMNLDDAIKATVRLGVRYISLKDFHLPLKSTSDQRREVSRKIKEAGLVLMGCGVIYMKNDESEIENAFEYARDAGIPTMVASPDPAAMGIVDKMVKKYGTRVAIHNHGPEDKQYPTPDSVRKAIEGYDSRIGLCIDIGHTTRSGLNAAAEIRKHAPRLYEIHFKDVDRPVAGGKTVEAGRGVIDIPAVLRALRDIGFQGNVALEFEKDADDPLTGMAESIGYARGVLRML